MAVGDVYSGLQSVASGATLDIRPAGTMEVVIHDIYYEYDKVELQWTDGVNTLSSLCAIKGGFMGGCTFHCTNSLWLRIKNIHPTEAKLIGYDGIVTHV